MSFGSRIRNNFSSTIVALASVAPGTATGPVLNIGALGIVEGTIVADVSAAVKTSTLTVATKIMVSVDGTTFVPLYTEVGTLCSAAVAAAGTGSLVTTAYKQRIPIGPSYKYVRLDVVVGVTTGGASDNVTIGYSFHLAG